MLLPAMSDTALVRKQKSLRKDYGLEQLLASDATPGSPAV